MQILCQFICVGLRFCTNAELPGDAGAAGLWPAHSEHQGSTCWSFPPLPTPQHAVLDPIHRALGLSHTDSSSDPRQQLNVHCHSSSSSPSTEVRKGNPFFNFLNEETATQRR